MEDENVLNNIHIDTDEDFGDIPDDDSNSLNDIFTETDEALLSNSVDQNSEEVLNEDLPNSIQHTVKDEDHSSTPIDDSSEDFLNQQLEHGIARGYITFLPSGTIVPILTFKFK